MERKQVTLVRAHERALHEIRSIDFITDALGYASASVLFSQGETKVLASITLQQGLPPFLKGQPVGWLSAEYAMLPSATHLRNNRESSQAQRNARSVEISRLIGRCLRTCVDLSLLRDKTIIIDCDVLQADGGTRVACITAASLALEIATKRWFDEKITEVNIFTERIVGISVGFLQNQLISDLDYKEDSSAGADFNFIITRSNRLVEVQGTSEKTPLAWEQFDGAKDLAQQSAKEIFSITEKKLASLDLQITKNNTNIAFLFNASHERQKASKTPHSITEVKQHQNQKTNPFSLGNRITKS
ncbi:ribonuclease PH [Candidatus Dependentiae bacterium]|nr:ribonuclease PH [Candidatus Dependentiae bacterium]